MHSHDIAPINRMVHAKHGNSIFTLLFVSGNTETFLIVSLFGQQLSPVKAAGGQREQLCFQKIKVWCLVLTE